MPLSNRHLSPPAICNAEALCRERGKNSLRVETTAPVKVARRLQGADSWGWHVAVPVDGSATAEHAVPHALAILRRSGGTMRLVQALPCRDEVIVWRSRWAGASLQVVHQRQQNYLADLATRIRQASGIPTETVLVAGNHQADALVEAMAGVDLVVDASRRSGWLANWWSLQGKTMWQRQVGTPVLQVYGKSTPAEIIVGSLPRHILVPVNGAVYSERILQSALAYARLAQAHVTLLNIQDEGWMRGHFDHTNPLAYLEGLQRLARQQGVAAEAQIVTTAGDVASAIRQFVRQQRIDLIAMASQSDGGLNRWMRGSVADSLLRSCQVPILLRTCETRGRRSEIIKVP
jgi:nucleotide-binding universal stress UspA family protein